jgi:hypothetical protein
MAGMRIRTSSDRTAAVGIGLMLLGMLLVVVGVFGSSSAQATQPNPEHKVTLCHATDSHSNPYVRINVDVASVLFHGHDGHNGPIFYAQIPKHQKWGDIIPPFNYGPGEQYAGKNWTSAGQTIWNANCQLTPSTTTTSEQGSTTLPSSTTTTTTAEQGSTTLPSSTTTTTTAEQSSTTLPSSTTTITTKTEGSTTTPTSSVTVKGEAITQSSTTTTTVAAARAKSLPFTGAATVPLLMGGFAMIGTGLALVRSRRRRTAI